MSERKRVRMAKKYENDVMESGRWQELFSNIRSIAFKLLSYSHLFWFDHLLIENESEILSIHINNRTFFSPKFSLFSFGEQTFTHKSISFDHHWINNKFFVHSFAVGFHSYSWFFLFEYWKKAFRLGAREKPEFRFIIAENDKVVSERAWRTCQTVIRTVDWEGTSSISFSCERMSERESEIEMFTWTLNK